MICLLDIPLCTAFLLTHLFKWSSSVVACCDAVLIQHWGSHHTQTCGSKRHLMSWKQMNAKFPSKSIRKTKKGRLISYRYFIGTSERPVTLRSTGFHSLSMLRNEWPTETLCLQHGARHDLGRILAKTSTFARQLDSHSWEISNSSLSLDSLHLSFVSKPYWTK